MSKRFLCLILLAAALRLLYVGLTNPAAASSGDASDLYRYLDGDGYLHHAQAIHEGTFLFSGEDDQFLRRMPLYPALLAFLSKFLLPDGLDLFWQIKFIQVWQALLDTLTLACVYLAVRRLFGEPAALWAGLGYALYPLAVYRLVMMNTEVIQSAALALFVLGAVHFWRTQKPLHAFCLSLLTSLVLYITPAFQFFPLFFTASFFLLFPKGRAWKPAAAYLLPVLLLVTLWGVRNYTVTGQFYLFDVRGGKEFWLGNHVASNGEWEGPYREVWESEYQALARDIAQKGGTKNEENRFFYQKGIREILADPAGTAVLWAKKFFRFWYVPERKILFWATIPLQSAYLLAALLGLYAARGRNAGVNLIAGVILYFCAIYTASYACIRFSHPVMPWVCALGGIGLAHLTQRFGRRIHE